MANDKVVHVTDDSFDAEVLDNGTPVLVDFWAEWCGPCKMIAPIIDELADDYDGKVKIAKIDTDAHRQVPAKFGIRGIPTMILFNNGEVVDQIVGAVPKEEIAALLDKALGDL